MKFQGSVIKEQGITFGIVIVKPHILQSTNDRENMQHFGRQAFGAIPIILMAQNSRGVPTYYGRTDIVNYLSHVATYRIPWKEYSIA